MSDGRYTINLVCYFCVLFLFYFFRDLCLETLIKFRDHQGKCYFDSSTANDILQDGRLFELNLHYCRELLIDFFVIIRELLYSNCSRERCVTQ